MTRIEQAAEVLGQHRFDDRNRCCTCGWQWRSSWNARPGTAHRNHQADMLAAAGLFGTDERRTGPDQARSADPARLSALSDIDGAGVLTQIAERLGWDGERIVVRGDWNPDPSGDPNLHTGPLTMAMWVMALNDLADALPPWDDAS